MKNIEDRIGQRFGALLVKELVYMPLDTKCRTYRALYLCICDCGKERAVEWEALSKGAIFSCQDPRCKEKAYSIENIKMYTYFTWHGMIQRCNQPTHKSYRFYGGKGITVCERWQGDGGFSNFIEDMGYRPIGKTLDRIDTYAGYAPVNCRWITRKEQARNSRSSSSITLMVGPFKQTIYECNDTSKTLTNTTFSRIQSGWPVPHAIWFPPASRWSKGKHATMRKIKELHKLKY